MQVNNETGFVAPWAQNDAPCHCEEGKARRTQGYHYSSAPASPGIEVRNRKTIENKGITTLAVHQHKVYKLTRLTKVRRFVLYRNDERKATRIIRDVAEVTFRSTIRAGSLCDTAPNRKCGFTLAEVLITLGIIGVVAAVTLPALITNVQSRIRSEQIRSAKYKFTLATDKMNSLGLIGPYDSTEAFVKELQKHLKLAKVCLPGKLEGCWPTKEVKLNAEGDMFEINKAVTGKQFKMETNDTSDYSSNNVGIVTADGVPMILNYNKKCEPLDSVKEYAWTTEDNKPVSNATAGCVAAVMDINGSKKPNKLSEDVVLFNAKGLGAGCGMEVAGKCFSAPISSYAPLTKAECEAKKNSLGIIRCYVDNDYWAGAVNACGGVNKMATLSDLATIAGALYGKTIGLDGDSGLTFNRNEASKLGLPAPGSSDFYFNIWSSEELSCCNAANHWYFDSEMTNSSNNLRSALPFLAVCLAD